MEKFDIFQDIAERTGGDIYVGVVGPVRTGKSTFIRRFLETLVLPNIKDVNERERAKDAMPQGAGGRTIMTTEPKFVPDDGIEIAIRDNLKLRVRLVDCVGYAVAGALGYEEEDGPRMVQTPWFEYEIPFQEAAEIGTRKVISDHSTIGLVVTTDGSITEIPREAYVEAEGRVVHELRDLGKPFVVILNSTHPFAKETRELADQLQAQYDVPVLPVDCAQLSQDDIYVIMEQVLYEFPVREVNINLPQWVEVLEGRHWLRKKFEDAVRETAEGIRRLRDIETAIGKLGGYDFVDDVTLRSMDMGTGVAAIDMSAKEALYYQILEEVSGLTIDGKHGLLALMRELAGAKREWDVVADAVKQVRETGYGMVPPRLADMMFADPELMKQGNRFGVRLKASAPSLHMIRADIETEITPIIGTEKQCEELVKYLMDRFEEDPKKLWESDIFGKSLHDLVREGIQNKLTDLPENARVKLQETLQRIINEGSGGLICIII
ncbi:MAG: stage IV sporulation protein A [Chloroflexota bacterium]